MSKEAYRRWKLKHNYRGCRNRKQQVFPRFINTPLPYDFYLELYLLGKVKKFKGRKHLRLGNLFVPWSRVMWILTHPDETLFPEDDIHHRDLDRTNDSLDNLERIEHKFHRELHHAKERVATEHILSRSMRSIIKYDQDTSFSKIPRTFNAWFNLRALNLCSV